MREQAQELRCTVSKGQEAMLKHVVPALIMSTLLAGGAIAQEQQKDANHCVQAAYDLAQAAEQKELSNERLDKVEDLLTKMEDLCDADRVAEAMAVAKDIEAEINAE